MTDSARRVAVLVNPHAGKGRGAEIGDAAIAHLRGRGAVVADRRGQSASEAASLLSELLADLPDALVVVGGDGTLSALAESLVSDGAPPVVLVPAGTGNDLARALGIPRDAPQAAAEAALSGSTRRIDVGAIAAADGVHLFLTIAALGFDAKVSERTNRLRYPRGRARYFLAIAIEVLRVRAMRFRLGLDGAEATDRPGTLIAIGNTASYGGGMPMCIGADPSDGLLDVVHVAPLSPLRLILLLPRLLAGTHLDRPEAQRQRARVVEVSAPDLVVYADGERIAQGACQVSVRPGALTMLIPEGAA
ncbi:diacylglycerol kinase family protein [Microbacterium sp. ZW T5_56]|uniref:diacylglycerol kinase family protein n=1 Tax=Microbacterium sp. ZW T5_56 TaxID=3378081 RepID=UPI003854CCCC